MTYWGFLGVVQGLDMLRQARLREVQLAEQRTALVRAQLESLKLQLQPHFLFNTLHAIGQLWRSGRSASRCARSRSA